MPRLPTPDELAAELRRQAETEAMRRGPVQDAAQFAYRAQTGALFTPRNVVAAVFVLGSGLFTACGGLLTWLWAHRPA